MSRWGSRWRRQAAQPVRRSCGADERAKRVHNRIYAWDNIGKNRTVTETLSSAWHMKQLDKKLKKAAGNKSGAEDANERRVKNAEGQSDVRKPWDPEPASFSDGVALVESLFAGDGSGEAFSAFIQCVACE